MEHYIELLEVDEVLGTDSEELQNWIKACDSLRSTQVAAVVEYFAGRIKDLEKRIEKLSNIPSVPVCRCCVKY